MLRLTRREWLELVAIVALAPACRSDKAPPPPTHDTPAPATPAPVAVAPLAPALAALADRILPADGDFPGARDAGVAEFIARQLTVEPFTRLAGALAALATALDGAAGKLGGKAFAALPVAQQDMLVSALASGKLGTPLPERELFRVMHGLVLEGFLADPHHGGNRDMIAWKAIGFPEPSLRTKGSSHGHGGM